MKCSQVPALMIVLTRDAFQALITSKRWPSIEADLQYEDALKLVKLETERSLRRETVRKT
jgi:hypothetical protein